MVTDILIIGQGRVGVSMAAYGRSLGLNVDVATHADVKAAGAPLAARMRAARVAAAAVPDSAIAPIFQRWRDHIDEGRRADQTFVHFSGALTVDGAHSYHPLYSFPKNVLPMEIMGAIPIAVEEAAPSFDSLFTGAPNPVFTVKREDRAFYHAIAVLTGNFAAHIWNEAATALEKRLPELPPALLAPYLAGVVNRFEESPTASITGPIARRDAETAAANLKSLKGAPQLEALYSAFVQSAWPEGAPALLPRD